jgi:hypothetical protein
MCSVLTGEFFGDEGIDTQVNSVYIKKELVNRIYLKRRPI